MSDSTRWDRIKALYHEALERDASRREAFLEEACAGDAELLSEVRSLLGYASDAKRLLERPVAEAVTNSVALSPGAQLDGYEILRLIGAGGMGEVYLARDLKLGREVAIKVLPPALADDPERRRRFEREARVAASLNHPNIAVIHGIGDHEGAPFIAMELVPGVTLRERLDAGPLSRTELLRFASQIASGLARAHRAGILHRDLKPGNLMVTPDGFVKLLDFGLAKQVSDAASRSSELTDEGAVMGTVHYMSPEQAKGRPLDERSDQFSLGSILYEMATGKRPFARESVSETLAAILAYEPPPLAVTQDLPPAFAAVVARCLSKDPAGRYASTEELARALEQAELAAAAAPAPPARRWTRVAGGLAAALAVVLAALVWRTENPAPAPAPAIRAPVRAVPLTSYPGVEDAPTFSPDASQVAFVWDGGELANEDIYVKVVGSEQALRLTSDPAREGSPAWSPDGRAIAFLRDRDGAGSEVRLIAPTGGSDRWLADVEAAVGHGLSWSPDGHVLAVSDGEATERARGLVLLDLATGSRRPLVAPPQGYNASYVHPAFSPDGRSVAFNESYEASALRLVDASGGESRALTTGTSPAWLSDGETLVFVAGSRQEAGVWRPSRATGLQGTLWAISARGGEPQPVPGTDGADSVATSPRVNRLAYVSRRQSSNIWRLDLKPRESGAETRTRAVASTTFDVNPEQSPDGERIAFTSRRTGNLEIWVADRNGGSLLQLTALGGAGEPGSPRWSPDGRSIAFDILEGEPQRDRNVYVVGASGGTPRRVTTHPAFDANPSWSADGAWIYFCSRRTGESQIWKIAASGGEDATARQVTREGGFWPLESADGQYVYYGKEGIASVWRVPVDGGEEERVIETLPDPKMWDIAADGIYYLDVGDEPDAPWTIQFLAFGAETPVQIVELGYEPFRGYGFSVSADGRWALSTENRVEADLMLLEDFR